MNAIDIRSPSFHEDPYPFLNAAREAGPLCSIEPYGFIGVTRYDDIVAVLKNPRVFSSTGMNDAFPAVAGAEFFERSTILLGSDPPDHTRVRRLVQRAFTLQAMAAWEVKIETLVEALFAKVGDAFDLVEDMAMPLPVTVIAEMLGVDAVRMQDFKRWSDDLLSMRAVVLSEDVTWRERREREIIASSEEFGAYFNAIIAARQRDSSGPDLISAMVRASEDDQIMKAADILGLTRLMLVAGNETTTNLLGNAVTALLNTPGQWARLVSDPRAAVGATEEALRFDGPVLQLLRRVTEDATIGGTQVAAGTILAPMIAAANRDPRKFQDPDRFDLTRDARAHLAFGGGIHLCVGAALARLETQIVLRELALRYPDLRFGDAPARRQEALLFRGFASLPVRRRGATIDMRRPLQQEARAHDVHSQ